jgi:hypothetical protein
MNIYTDSFCPRGRAFAIGVLGAVLCFSATAKAAENTPKTAQKVPAPSVPDDKRLFALGMIETGNDDREVGGLGEISRFQILPVVWKAYSDSRDYRNPRVSVHVAEKHWAYLADYYKEKTGRTPSDFDMYVLWNTSYGYYAKQGFSPRRIAAVVRDRAQRFVNLVNRNQDGRFVTPIVASQELNASRATMLASATR